MLSSVFGVVALLYAIDRGLWLITRVAQEIGDHQRYAVVVMVIG